MLNIIYCELLKLKKTYMVHVALVCAMFMSVIMVLGQLIIKEKMQPFIKHASTIEMINILLLYTILFSLIAGYVFSREFVDKTASIVYGYSIPRIKIFIGKLIAIYILIFLVYVVKFISLYLEYYILTYTLPESTFIFSHIKYNIYSLIFEFLIIPIPILIANLSKNIMLPVVYGVVGTIATNALGNKLEYSPLIIPYKAIEKLFKPNLVDLKYCVISGVLCFIISISMCIYQYNKDDII